MKPGRTLLGAGESLLDRVLCVAGAIIFSQVPEFMQQYLQRLGGHLDEARRQLEQFQHTAAQSGITLDRLIALTAADPKPAVARLAGVMSEAVKRVDTLAAAQATIQHASVWTRPFVFFKHLDPSIAKATWAVFQPAVPTTMEGLVYALLGVIILMTIYHLGIKYPLTRGERQKKPKPVVEDYIPLQPKPEPGPARPVVPAKEVATWAQPPTGAAPPRLKK